MTPFIVGFIMGALLVACAFAVYLTRQRIYEDDDTPADWTEEHYTKPIVTTRVLIRERNYEL